MNSRRRLALPVLAMMAAASGPGAAAASDGQLAPYQMVRSLELVQDRIAGGDHAALPMQRKLLQMIDARMRAASSDDFSNRRNVHALMIYAMSGGNPATIADSLARLDINEADRAAGAGILGYLTGDVEQARTALSTVDPADQPPEVAPFLYLVKGSVIAPIDSEAGLALLDQARLLGTGTLVEEAALRRTISLVASAGDSARFLLAAEQYARRFLRSPYASQFAETFVAGIIDLRAGLDLRQVEQAVAWMTPEQARTVYLRLARQAAIDGDARLLQFASAGAKRYSGADAGDDPRGELYSSISSVTSETVEDVLSRLELLDPAGLSAKDRALLDAARTIASEVVAPVATQTPVAYRPQQDDGGPDAAIGARTASDELVSSTRSKLEAIDRLLEEAQP